MRNIEVEYDYLQSIQKDLTTAFIAYQWNLDHPFPYNPKEFTASSVNLHSPIGQYQTNPQFRHKVDRLVAGVLQIVQKHV